MLEISRAKIETAELSYLVLGNGEIDIVVELGLGSCIGEWLHIAQKLSEKHTVLLYERAGCGTSGESSLTRTPKNIAKELNALLNALGSRKKLKIIAHSQGGLYAQQFARLFPDRVESLILLDPLSANDDEFKRSLTPNEYKKGGIDKFSNLRVQYTLARLHMGGLIKALMKNAPPFYYFSDFSADASEYILSCLTRPLLYKTAMEEYALSHAEENVAELRERSGFPPVPLHLITHSSQTETAEITQFGGATQAEAEKVEALWQSLMKQYLAFTPLSDHTQAARSAHFIHLTEFPLVERFL